MNFKEQMIAKKDLMEKELESCFTTSNNSFEVHIQDAMRYSLLSGGKRIRPILLIEVAYAFGLKLNDVLDFACALEMIHTYSLIHDDLPAMDDDDYRRNKPSNHKIYGEGIAILAGDGLLTSAFNVMIKKCLQTNEPHKYLKAMAIIGKASGHEGMIGGQVADLKCENKACNEKELDYIHSHKTGKLLAAPLEVAGVLSGQDEKIVKSLSDLGQIMGLIFQITDDLLDIEGDPDTFGKPIGSDEKNHKLTYPGFHGIERSKEKISHLTEEGMKIINTLPGDHWFLTAFLKYLCKRNK